MKKIVLVAALGLGLAGCASNGTLQIPTALTPAAITTDVAQVQSIAKNLCGWVEPVSVIAQIIAAFSGGGGIVSNAHTIATQICATVTVAPQGARRGMRVATVYGVPLRGRFVR